MQNSGWDFVLIRLRMGWNLDITPKQCLRALSRGRKMSENERLKKKKKDKAAAERKQKRMAAEEQQVDFARDQAAPAEESRIGARRAPGYEERRPQVDSTHQHILPPPSYLYTCHTPR